MLTMKIAMNADKIQAEQRCIMSVINAPLKLPPALCFTGIAAMHAITDALARWSTL